MRSARSHRGRRPGWLRDGTRAGQQISTFSAETWRRLGRSLRWSHREAQIAPGLFEDYKETTIAARLGISPHTVHTHTERLYRKMGISSRVGLVRRIFLEYLRVSGGEHSG